MDRRYAWYRWISALGLQSVRILKRIGRRVRPFALLLKAFGIWLYRKTVGSWMAEYRRRVAAIKKYRKQRGKEADRCVKALRRSMACSVLNVAVPIVAVAALLWTVRFWNQMEYGLFAECAGEPVGVLEDETVFEDASAMLYGQMTYDTVSEVEVQAAPAFRLLASTDTAYAGADRVSEALLEQTEGIQRGAGLYIDGVLVGAVSETETLSSFLAEILAVEKEACNAEEAYFLENVEIVTGLFAECDILTMEDLQALLAGTAQTAETYRAKQGDTLEKIAQRQAVPALLLSAENGGLRGTLEAETTVRVGAEDPLLHVVVVKTETYEQEFPYGTVTTEDASLYSDEKIVTQEGENGTERRKDRVSYLGGEEIARESLERVVLEEAVDEQVTVGTLVRPTGEEPGVASGIFSWPTPTLWTVTSEYGARWGTVHQGMDISGGGATGQPIVASDAGVVSFVAYHDYGYGYHVEIDHGNGFVTRYAHASDIAVTQGQKVAKGDVIAYVGSTGDSTGPHLHFEIIASGVQVDPRLYLE